MRLKGHGKAFATPPQITRGVGVTPTIPSLLSPENIFPEALELMEVHPAGFRIPQAKASLHHLENIGTTLDPGSLRLMNRILSRFGEFLILNVLHGESRPVSNQAVSLIQALHQARNKPALMRHLLRIEQLCKVYG